MKKHHLLIVFAILLSPLLIIQLLQPQNATTPSPYTSNERFPDRTSDKLSTTVAIDDQAIKTAVRNRRSNVQVHSSGKVSRILPDDTKGSRHQRFIIKISTGQTVLIAHNIDLAPRINTLKVGDIIEFYGVYEWNDKGGVVHWTHHDPNNRHIHGWIHHDGQTYQ